MSRLTKADILKGSSQVKTKYFDKLGGEVSVRPLTEGEWSEIEAMRGSGAKITGSPKFDKNGNFDIRSMQRDLQVEINSKDIQVLEFEAKAKAVAWGLSVNGEEWTPDEVRQLRPVGIVGEIAEFIFEISGVTNEASEGARSFRQDDGGSEDSPATPSRDTVQ